MSVVPDLRLSSRKGPDPLARFAAPTRTWFQAVFGAPTEVQTEAWEQIEQGKNCLVIAPTGSGKTLAAFLQSIDTLMRVHPDQDQHKPSSVGVRVLYISPLKALGVDVEKNLRIPLNGIAATAHEQGVEIATVGVGIRSGDTTSSDRRRLTTHPPQILITTPESLFLMLSSAASGILTGIDTVILDEVHYLAGNKRGAHLALSLERLQAMNMTGGFQRIGLSATVRPPETVARFLGGVGRDVTIVAPATKKNWQLDVVVPIEDMTQLAIAPPVSITLDESIDDGEPLPDPPVASMMSGRSGPSPAGQDEYNGPSSDSVPPVVPASSPPPASPALASSQSLPSPVSSGAEWDTSDMDRFDSGPASRGLSSPQELRRMGKRGFDLSRGTPTDKEMRRAAKADSEPPKPSMWPHVEAKIFELVMAHTSTICFCNSRGVAEKLTTHLNDLYHETAPLDTDGVIARTHHGSISKALRTEIEEELKDGRLPCVVATNSLELGIDMGAVDLVIQVSAPPSVSSGLQRIGRGGHQVSAVSHGVLLPTSRSDLLATAVVTQLMTEGRIEEIHRIVNPLDVLAQHIASMCLDTPQTPEGLLAVIRRTDAFADLPERAFTDVIDMLTGKYPSDDFSELRPRLVWDPESGTLSARPGVRRLVTTSGGTIPDRGLYGVFMAGTDTGSGKRAVSRRVGELDEEMVYESRVGDVFTLGTSAWRIDEINPNQVIVTPVPGQAGRLPFWHGDEVSRSAEVGHEMQKYVSELQARIETGGTQGSGRGNLDQWAYDNLLSYIREQKAATSVLPDEHTILVELGKDEMGAWRACVHSQLGKAVLRPWAMAIQRRIRDVHGNDVQVFITDDGITIRLGEVDNPSIGDMLAFDPDEIGRIVAEETTHSALFAAHFRQCAARALLLPKKDPGKRTPLWQQRLRSSHLLGVAAHYPSFPIIAEALRECLDDVFDMDSLKSLMRDLAAHRVRIVEVETPRPSPFAVSMLFGYTGAFLYYYDQPLAERAVAASLVDPALLASLLGTKQPETMDEEILAEVEAGLQRLTPGRQASTMEAFWDLLRQLGPLTLAECAERCQHDPSQWLADLESAGRIAAVEVGGKKMVAVAGDAALIESLPDAEAVDRLVSRWVRSHTVVTADDIASRYGVPVDQVRARLDTLVAQSTLRRGHFIDKDIAQYMSEDVAERVTRRTVTQLRARVRPVEQRRFASFLTRWHELDAPGRGVDDCVAAAESLAGYPIPASMLESVVLPGRVADYEPSMLDQVMSSSEITWSGHGGIGEADGWICLWPADTGPLVRPQPLDDLSLAARTIYERLAAGGAWGIDALVSEEMAPSQVQTAIWELVWAGRVSSDTLAPVRALSQGQGALRRPHVAHTRRIGRPRMPVRIPGVPPLAHRAGWMGRWYAIPEPAMPETARLVTAVNWELDRYGILTKGSVLTEAMTPAYFDVYKILTAMETQGVARRGYFIDNLGAAQFALPGAVDRLREDAHSRMILVAACDPANPWGASLAWPDSLGHRPARKAGALVVLDDGWPVIYLERGAHTLVTFDDDTPKIVEALRLVGDWIDRGRLDTISFTRVNSQPALQVPSWIPIFDQAGYAMTPQGFRRRANLRN